MISGMPRGLGYLIYPMGDHDNGLVEVLRARGCHRVRLIEGMCGPGKIMVVYWRCKKGDNNEG